VTDVDGGGSPPPGERSFRRLAETLPAAAYTCDAEGRITFYNARAAQLFGREPRLGDAEERYSGALVLYAPDGAPVPHDHCFVARALREGREFDGEEVAVERPDGRRVYVLSHVRLLRDDAGRITGASNVLLDVTDRRAAEARLESSERRFEEFMRHLPGLAWIKDLDGRYVFANDAAENAFQRRRHELYGRRDEELFPAEISAVFRENDRKALRSTDGLETVETLEHADGIRSSLVSKFPIAGPDGEPCWIGGIAIDITARIAAEAALRESEARFRDMADHAPVLIWMNGPHGCDFVNREYLRFLGAAQDDVRGAGWQRFIHPSDAEAYVAEYVASTAARRPFEARLRFRRADGQYRWLRSTGVPRVGADGSLLGYVGCSVDITDLQRTQEVLRDADRRKDEFLATLAHELRNPLAPIRSALEVLRDDPRSHGELYPVLERQVSQLVRLVDDLLDLSRIAHGHIELRPERVALADVLRSAIETARPQLDASGHALAVRLPDAPLWLDADPLRLSQLFVNLLVNAARYTPDGGHVEVAAQTRGGEAVVAVRDDGIGIAADMLPRVFDPFTRVEDAPGRARFGLGIGLALVAEIASRHGGRVEARSDGPGKGSEFRVTLPLAAVAGALESASRRQPPAAARAPAALRGPVLVVDDNRDAAESLARLLRFRGLRVEVAFDGTAALRAAPALRPALVLLDLSMPGLDGFEVARRLRAERACDGALLVALTGWDQPDVAARCAEAGFDHHLAKPVALEAIAALLPARGAADAGQEPRASVPGAS
jgi:PAS domain S-box-containing protein